LLKKIISIVLLLTLTVVIIPVFPQTSQNEWIRIGIYFNDKRGKVKPLDSINIESANSLYLYYSDDKNFTYIVDLGIKEAVVSKDVYNTNGSTKYSYHIKVGRYISFTDAKRAASLIKTNENVFVGFVDGAYSIMIGNYGSQQIANDKAKTIYGAEIFTSDSAIVINDKDSKPLFLFDSKQLFLMIGPKPESQIERIKAGNRWYRGRIEFKRLTPSDMTVINVVKLEEYLYGIIRMEIDPMWNIEVVKAFAVVARTYTMSHIGKHKDMGFDLCATDDCQVYGGAVDGTYGEKNAILAVDSTRGEVITYNGKLINAVYFSSTGGIPTEDSENVWKYKVDYLRSVDNSKEPTTSKSSWTFQFTAEELKNVLLKKNVNIGDIIDVQVLEKTKAGRVLKLKVVGTTGEYIAEKETTRTILGLYSQAYDVISTSGSFAIDENQNKIGIPSDVYIVTEEGQVETIQSNDIFIVDEEENMVEFLNTKATFTFNGKGWGHGVGMSQWGAKGLADMGYNYKQIIKHYYTGVEIEKK